MKDWLAALADALARAEPSVLVTIADARGSAPREAGVKMLVTGRDTAGTVGGGNLEHEAIRLARRMIAGDTQKSELRSFALGPNLGQCCGGHTSLLFEPMAAGGAAPAWVPRLAVILATPTPCVLASAIEGEGAAKLLLTEDEVVGAANHPDLRAAARNMLERFDDAAARLWTDADGRRFLLERLPGSAGDVLLIGAGHVGKALMNILRTLPFRVTWADNRPEQFSDEIESHIRVRCTPHLDQVIDEAPAGAIYLVMTYSHDLDYALCARVLQRGDFRYLGLIGSKTKRARFEKTMADLGIAPELVARTVCPIGLPGIDSKQPSVIAVATAAQLLALAKG